jgi:hypothetical protein
LAPREFAIHAATASLRGRGVSQEWARRCHANRFPTVRRPNPPVRVIDYLKDFGNIKMWDPGTPSPIREDSTWHNVSKIVGAPAALTYTLGTLSNDTKKQMASVLNGR